ncbi:MAG: DUF3047 domain-containing protein [Rubricoccaceae bacterium]
MRPSIRVLLATACVLSLTAFMPSTDYVLAAFSNMSPGGAVQGWEPLSFDDGQRTQYSLVEYGGTTVVRANANRSASGLIRRVTIDPNRFPVLTWRWKVEGVLPRGDVRRKSGDDYPARIYITFDKDPSELSFADRVRYRAVRALGYDDVPVRALNYIWANQASEGQIVPNPYTDWVKMIPVQSGNANAETWQIETRDVVRDYRAAFGEDPPPINGIAIMTDADNTKGSATAYYGDMRMRAR